MKGRLLTSNTGKQLASEALDLAVRERDEVVTLQKVEDARAKQIHNNTYMTSVIETVAEVDTSIAVLVVVGFQCLQDPKLYP